MSLHHDLLAQARHLANREPKRPKQASLRRSVSTSYYALFHLLTDSAVRRLVQGRERVPLQNCLRRGFSNSTMKRVARQFASGSLSPKIKPALNNFTLQPELVSVAQTFADLQEHRHEADYNIGRGPFTRIEALGLILDVESAFPNWNVVRKSVQADVFLVGLLAFETLQV